MKVSDLFKQLSLGELSALSIGMNGAGDIKPEAQASIILHANAALVRLYSRFTLSEKELIIEMVDGITNYHLLSRFAESNCDRQCGDYPYIRDHADPFNDDLIRVLRVVNECGVDLPLNDEHNPDSLFTPKTHQLQIPRPYPGKMVSVIYQAHHPKLEYGVKGAEISVPLVLEKALTSYIAGQVFSNMSGPENSQKGVDFMNMYEVVCQEVAEHDTVNESVSTTDTKFKERGFV